MSYIGNQSENKVSPARMREYVTGDGSATTFDLSHDIPGYGAENLIVVVNNVIQEPATAYTITNDANGRPRRLDFGSGNVLATTDTCYVIYQATGQIYHTPPANSVGYSQLEANLRSGRVDQFAGSAGASSNTVFTLTETVLNVNSIMVYVNGIYQRPTTNYTVSGTALTFTASLADTDEVDVHHMSIRSTVSHVADGSVTTAKLDDVGVTTAKIANDAVTGAKIENNPTIAGNLSITGTSTFTGASTFSGGIANTGTISAGTLGSDIVFPAGHTVQIVSDDITTSAASDATTSGTLILVERGSNIYDWRKQITGVTAGNWVYVTMGFKFFNSKSSTDTLGCGFGIFHSTADDGSGTSVIYQQASDTQYYHLGAVTNSVYQNMEYIQFSYMHKTPSAGNNTYYLGYKGQNNGSDAISIQSQAISGASGGTPFHITLMEIQQ